MDKIKADKMVFIDQVVSEVIMDGQITISA